MNKIAHNLLVARFVHSNTASMLGTIKQVQFAIGVLANVVHIHAVMWLDEGIGRAMDKTNGHVAVFYTVDGDSFGKVVANLFGGNDVGKVHRGERWHVSNLETKFTVVVHRVGKTTVGNKQVDVATQAKFAQNCYCAHTFAVERQKAILTEQIFCVVDNCAKIELFVESKCCVGAIGKPKVSCTANKPQVRPGKSVY